MNRGGKRRRPKGEGSYSQRTDGTWQFRIDTGKDEKGARVRRYVYAPTRAKLVRKVFDLKATSGGSIKPRAGGTVGEWVERWLADDVKPNRSRNTYALYETMWRVHAAPILQNDSLEKLDPGRVAELYQRLRAKGASPTVTRKVGAVVSRAIEVATRRGVFHRANPFALVDKPTVPDREQRVLTIAEARRLLTAAKKDRLEAMWVLQLTAGLRLGEALGLQWGDVDFTKRRLSIIHNLTEVNGVVELGSTKTRGSRRSVDLGALALEALRRRRKAAKLEGHSSEFVFPTPTGTPQRRSNVRQREYEPLLKRAKLANVRIHDLRHAMTSFGIAAGVAPKVLAERLGHTTVRMTEDRYAHVLPSLQREAADTIDALLRKRPRAK